MIRDIDLVQSEEQYLNYLRHRSYGSKKILEYFYGPETTQGYSPFSVDNSKVMLDYTNIPGTGRNRLITSKEEKDKGFVYLETPNVEITEEREIRPRRSDPAQHFSFNEWTGGVDGLAEIHTEIENLIRLYLKIFPSERPRWGHIVYHQRRR